jgi:hypothetical protein
MQPRIRIGLIVGIIGLVLNVCVSGFVGLCGPFLSLLAGGIAGFFAAQQEKPMTKSDGARAGATAGGLAGGLIILGQIIGGLTALYYMQAAGMPSIFGQVPSLASSTAAQATYYLGGVGTALCFGIVGALLAAATGAGAGYLGTTEQPVIPPPPYTIS